MAKKNKKKGQRSTQKAKCKVIKIEYFVLHELEMRDGKLETKGVFDFEHWISNSKDKLSRIFVNLSDCTAMLTDVEYLENNSYIAVRFYKAREGSIPERVKEGDRPQSIQLEPDEKVAEGLCLLYDCDNKIMTIQKSRFSLSRKHLSEIFSLYPNNPGTSVSFEQIIDKSPAEYVKRSKIKEIYVRVANPELIKKDSALSLLLGNSLDFEGGSISFRINAGKSNKNKLNSNLTGEVIDEISADRGNYSIGNATVKIYDDDKGRLDIYDLLENKCRDHIVIDSNEANEIEFREIASLMLTKYKTRKDELTRILNPGE